MSVDCAAIARALACAPRVVRVVLAQVAGSSPREAGAAMLVWDGGQAGTIGGGALEWQAAARARALLARGGCAMLERVPLGPGLGQCCGGAVALAYEVLDAVPVESEAAGWLRPVGPDAAPEPPLPLRRALARARAGQGEAPVLMSGGWLLEPVARPAHALWVWGAGHVGRAIVAVAAPLPDLAITWIDTAADRFPDTVPAGVTVRVADPPGLLVAQAPADARHLVLTYSHALDLDLCHRLLGHGFGALGLIGSDSKRARFRSRLAALGHGPGQIDRIACPIGDPALGKHPQAIAVGVVADLVAATRSRAPIPAREDRA